MKLNIDEIIERNTFAKDRNVLYEHIKEDENLKDLMPIFEALHKKELLLEYFEYTDHLMFKLKDTDELLKTDEEKLEEFKNFLFEQIDSYQLENSEQLYDEVLHVGYDFLEEKIYGNDDMDFVKASLKSFVQEIVTVSELTDRNVEQDFKQFELLFDELCLEHETVYYFDLRRQVKDLLGEESILPLIERLDLTQDIDESLTEKPQSTLKV